VEREHSPHPIWRPANTSNRVAWTGRSCRILVSGGEGQLWFQWLDPISAIRPRDLGVINCALVASAQREKRETAAMVRIDSTVTAALVNEQSDSAAAVGCRAGDVAAAASGGQTAGSAGDPLS
jgi:hypothetical protein